jgi:hypothetical protein
VADLPGGSASPGRTGNGHYACGVSRARKDIRVGNGVRPGGYRRVQSGGCGLTELAPSGQSVSSSPNAQRRMRQKIVGDVVRDTAALTDRPLRRELTEGGAKAGSRLRGRFPYGGNLLRRRCPGSVVPLRRVSTLTCVSPRTAGDGHPHSTLRCSPALSEALGDSSGRCSGPPLVVP